MLPKEIFIQLSLWIVIFYLKSYIFCLHFILYLHVWIRFRIPNTNRESSWIWIQNGSGFTITTMLIGLAFDFKIQAKYFFKNWQWIINCVTILFWFIRISIWNWSYDYSCYTYIYVFIPKYWKKLIGFHAYQSKTIRLMHGYFCSVNCKSSIDLEIHIQ